jgi:6-phosphogluconolactonase
MTANSDPPATKFADSDLLSRALSRQIAANLSIAIAARGLASLVVSGGKSPIKLFELLRAESLDWSRVCVALVDERWVDPSDPDSNEKLVRDVLLKEAAAAARFIGLKNAAPTPDLGAVSAWETFARVPRPFDAVVLGMGDDGHTASLFPRSPKLASAMRSPVAPHPRLSLNLSALLDSRRIVVLITGAQKWSTYCAASADGPAEEMPIRCVLRQRHTPVEVMWAP